MPCLPFRISVGRLITPLLFAGLFGPAVHATPLNDVQAAAADWARLRSETTRIETDWLSEKQVLSASVASLEIEADQLEFERDALRAETSKERDELDRLTSQNQTNAARLAATHERIVRLSDELIALRPTLPPRLSAALELPFRSIADADLGPADRMRHTMAILNRAQQFNQTFVMSEEVLAIAAGDDPRLLEIVYWGLAQACALDRAAGDAFIGRPVYGRWTWTMIPGFADAAADLMDIRTDKTEPRFVELPLQITGGGQ